MWAGMNGCHPAPSFFHFYVTALGVAGLEQNKLFRLQSGNMIPTVLVPTLVGEGSTCPIEMCKPSVT
jgi:hypothetical protein